jgi:ribosomal protein S18 acetylase RimI-like enzyme
LEIRRASADDEVIVWGIIDRCSDWLVQAKGLGHWKKYYTRERVSKYVSTKEVYLGAVNNQFVATMALSFHPVDYYTDEYMSCFADPEAQAGYISALASLPDIHSQGIGSTMMEFAEARTLEMGVRYLRLDCRTEYVDLVRFYNHRGFKEVGTIVEGNEPYLLMEKKIGD